MYDSLQWKHWLSQEITKEFIKQIKSRRDEYVLTKMTNFTEESSIIKDYFFSKGTGEGMLQTIDLMYELSDQEKTQEVKDE